jgi:hypothetical protein
VLSIVLNMLIFMALYLMLYVALCSRVKVGLIVYHGLTSNDASVCRGAPEWHRALLKR